MDSLYENAQWLFQSLRKKLIDNANKTLKELSS